MKTFNFTISAIGYETTTLTVEASTTLVAKVNFTREAFRKFARNNDISMSDAKGFGSLTIEKVKP